MNIRRFEERDVINVADLAIRTFKKYNDSDYYEPEAITYTLDFFDPDKNTKQELAYVYSKYIRMD